MRSLFILALLASILSACASTSDYQRWTSQPTPAVWKARSTWVLVLLDEEGEVARSLTVRFTDQRADSCTEGDWRRVEILAERPARHPSYLGKPAYELHGSALTIDLSANLCDNYYTLRGRLTENGVSGSHASGGMFGGKVLGTFHGAPIGE